MSTEHKKAETACSPPAAWRDAYIQVGPAAGVEHHGVTPDNTSPYSSPAVMEAASC